VLDDALINRSKRVNGEALEWCGVYDRQLTRWLSQHLTPAQRREVTRLQSVQRDQRRVLKALARIIGDPSPALRLGKGILGRVSLDFAQRLACEPCWLVIG
jgi:hypothetical protein